MGATTFFRSFSSIFQKYCVRSMLGMPKLINFGSGNFFVRDFLIKNMKVLEKVILNLLNLLKRVKGNIRPQYDIYELKRMWYLSIYAYLLFSISDLCHIRPTSTWFYSCISWACHVDFTVLSIFQKTVTFDHNLTPFT